MFRDFAEYLSGQFMGRAKYRTCQCRKKLRHCCVVYILRNDDAAEAKPPRPVVNVRLPECDLVRIPAN
jgi:hypothetical protein